MGGGEVARYLGKYGGERVRRAVFVARRDAVSSQGCGPTRRPSMSASSTAFRAGPDRRSRGLSLQLFPKLLQRRCAARNPSQRRCPALVVDHRRRGVPQGDTRPSCGLGHGLSRRSGADHRADADRSRATPIASSRWRSRASACPRWSRGAASRSSRAARTASTGPTPRN